MPRSALSGTGPVWRESLETAALSPRSQSESEAPATPIVRAATRFTSRRPSRSTITMLPSRGAERSQGSPAGPAGGRGGDRPPKGLAPWSSQRRPRARCGAQSSPLRRLVTPSKRRTTSRTLLSRQQALLRLRHQHSACSWRQALAASIPWSCRSGTFARCSGLK